MSLAVEEMVHVTVSPAPDPVSLAPELFPAMLYFNPRSIPSTFESEAGRAKRYDSMARKRTRAALDLLSTLEEQAAGTGKKAFLAAEHCQTAESLLRARFTNPLVLHQVHAVGDALYLGMHHL